MIRILELFGGIGACSKALERLGIEYEIADYVEIDKYAVASFNAMHGTDFKPQDIKDWDKDIEVDLIVHGSPCQDFSVAGLQRGGDEGSGTRSSLMYETVRIIKKTKPKYIIWENVKNLLSKNHIHNFIKYIDILQELGYNSYYQVLNAKDYGIPQNRERVFTISIRKDIDKGYWFPPKQELKLRLKDLLEENVDESYFLKKFQNKRLIYTLNENKEDLQDGTVIDSYNKKINNSGVIGTITTGVSFLNETHIVDSSNGGGRINLIDRNNYYQWYEKGFFESDCRASKENSISLTLTTRGNNKVAIEVNNG